MVKTPWNWPGKVRGVDDAPACFSRLHQLAHGEEAVELAWKSPVRDCHAGLLQSPRIFVALVAQGIGARGQHIRRRQAGPRARARRRCTPVADIGLAVEIMVAKPPDDGMRE